MLMNLIHNMSDEEYDAYHVIIVKMYEFKNMDQRTREILYGKDVSEYYTKKYYDNVMFSKSYYWDEYDEEILITDEFENLLDDEAILSYLYTWKHKIEMMIYGLEHTGWKKVDEWEDGNKTISVNNTKDSCYIVYDCMTLKYYLYEKNE